MLVKIVTPSSGWAPPQTADRVTSRAHHLKTAERVHVDQAHFRERRSGRYGSGHSVGDVVEFQVEEDLKTEARKRFYGLRAFG